MYAENGGRPAPPVNISSSTFTNASVDGFISSVRPNIVQGEPFYLYGQACLAEAGLASGSSCPGGRAINKNAFVAPPTNPVTGAYEEGNLGRNALRGYGATQWDLGATRSFLSRERLRIEFRSEMFNVLNHPTFGPPVTNFASGSTFGVPTTTLAQSLGGGSSAGAGSGGLATIYNIGGPRSIRFALKLIF